MHSARPEMWPSCSATRRLCLIVGVHAIGFVESRSDSTTRTAQRQRTIPELKPSDTGRVVRLIISVSAPMESGQLASHRASAHCSPRDVYSDPIPRAASPQPKAAWAPGPWASNHGEPLKYLAPGM